MLDKEDVKKMAVDAMFKLEHGVQDQQKSKKALPTLAQLKVTCPYGSLQRKVEHLNAKNL